MTHTEHTTKGEWREMLCADKEEAESRLLTYLERYPDLKNDEYQHKREQLYLMLSWGYREEETALLLESPMVSQDIDFLRLLALLLDFEFVKENFLGKSFYYEDAIDAAAKRLVREKFPAVSEIEKLKSEKEAVEKDFQLRMTFLQERMESEKTICRLESSHVLDLQKKDQEIMRNNLEHEIERYKEQIHALQEQNHLLQQENESLKQSPEKEKEEAVKSEKRKAKAPAAEQRTTGRKTALGIGGRLKKRKQAQKNRFIIDLMQNTEFDTEQLKLINHAFCAGLPEKSIKDLARPELPLENMKMLLSFFRKNYEIQELPMGEDEENHFFY